MDFYTNALQNIARELIESPEAQEPAEIAKNDMTEIFYKEIDNHIENNEVINISIKGEVRKGKSTCAIALAVYGQERLRYYKKTKKQFTVWNIARSQYEFSKKIRDPSLNNIFMVIDEFDDLEETGENVTIDIAANKQFTKVQAMRYIHRISCSPSDTVDQESDIILNVIQPDRQSMITLCRIYVKLLIGEQKYTQLIGYVKINVALVIKNWIAHKIEKVFYKQNHTQEEQKFINRWRKRDFYVDYMCRKLEKINMLNEKGIFQTKRIDYADMELKIIEDLKDLTLFDGVELNDVKNKIRQYCMRDKVYMSILGEELMAKRIDAVLASFTLINNEQRKLDSLKQKLISKPNDKYTVDYIESLQKAMIGRQKTVAEQMNLLRYMVEIKKKYYEEIE